MGWMSGARLVCRLDLVHGPNAVSQSLQIWQQMSSNSFSCHCSPTTKSGPVESPVGQMIWLHRLDLTLIKYLFSWHTCHSHCTLACHSSALDNLSSFEPPVGLMRSTVPLRSSFPVSCSYPLQRLKQWNASLTTHKRLIQSEAFDCVLQAPNLSHVII